MIFDNLLRYAVRVVETYAGDKPLHSWLKDFFRSNPQMGSRDRKLVSEMVYCYYRLGHTLSGVAPADRVLAGLFLCNEAPLPALEFLKPEWNEKIGEHIENKTDLIARQYPGFSADAIFPFHRALSQGVDRSAFARSFLIKPELFIRLRPGREEAILEKLLHHQIPFHSFSPSDHLLFKACAFANSTKLDGILALNQEAVVQDLSSQQTAALLNIEELRHQKPLRVWDCCAASGGKSILLVDLYPDMELTVSDIRLSILANLKKRFAEAGITHYQGFEADLRTASDLPSGQFDLIVADLPCTGSGTWSRTPEALYFFDPAEIERYAGRQKKILQQVVKRLRPGGWLVYITCSVFAEENEEVVRFIEKEEGLVIQEQRMITGYNARADSLFAARLRRRGAGC
ncbi:MAG TPA: hypothetical protein VG890_08750 [Puia sp.]|nr:hypothetical protein [Puia sp.]